MLINYTHVVPRRLNRINLVNLSPKGRDLKLNLQNNWVCKTKPQRGIFGVGILILILFLMSSNLTMGQNLTQVLKGTVKDAITLAPLEGASIVLLNSDPIMGTTTDSLGVFTLKDIPIGRHSFEISMLGYQTHKVSEILLNSGKQLILDIKLKEDQVLLGEVIVRHNIDRTKPINSLATVSGRQFSVEQTQRFAGGLDDPARLVSSFAGAANPSVSSNGISIRGNSPSGLLWRIEGVEVPSPNHFANLSISGAGLLTVLSGQVMGNSDFYTGAFPAEYGNASSGVFDIKLRNGNSSNREYTLKAGLLGMEFATEGPLKKGKEASYLFNYRYSTLALIGAFLPDDAGVLKYQDLSYKINIPTKNSGTFSLWGVGAYDGVDTEAEEREEWESIADRDNSQTKQYMFGSGLNHKILLGEKSILNSALSFSGNGLDFKEQRLDDNLQERPKSLVKKDNYRMTLQSSLTHYFGKRHTNRSGFYYTHMGYDLNVDEASALGAPLVNIVSEDGQTDLLQFFSSSKIDLTTSLELNGGVHLMYFDLNKELLVEPRISLKYDVNKNQSLALAYGRHSRTEDLSVYFVNVNGAMPNKDLSLMKSNHWVLSYNTLLTDNLKLSVEPYYQYLSNVPVSPNSYVSPLNSEDILFFDEALVSSGTGRNFGVDVTLERFLDNGLYYLFSGSLFDSKYTAGDGIQRNTRFNKNYVVNALVGKEWKVGKEKNNLVSANLRMNYLGGNKKEAVDEPSSIAAQDVVYGETNGNLSFEEKFPDLPVFSFTLSYRKNKKKHSSVWSLQVLNASQTSDFQSNIFNLNTQTVQEKYTSIPIPNLSYKIEF